MRNLPNKRTIEVTLRVGILILFTALCSFLFTLGIWQIAMAGGADSKFSPGDKVCIYDIGDDPLVDNKSSDSLKYWYRLPSGDQVCRYQLRPMVRELMLIVLWPGFKISGKGDDGQPWYSGLAVVIHGGKTPGKGAYPVKKGENILMRENGRTIVMDYQTLYFDQVRLKKDRPGPLGCRRKYEKY